MSTVPCSSPDGCVHVPCVCCMHVLCVCVCVVCVCECVSVCCVSVHITIAQSLPGPLLTVLLCQLLGLFSRHCLLGSSPQVTLHPHEDAGRVRAVVLDLREPLVSDIFKGSTTGYVKADNKDVCHGV